ncbi:DUF4097 family beta strand repeat-containing protein [Dyella jiangningensis]|uniref:DUF4097 domain-containing protein n=1 Tax=Dyella jiangningensis TaxID=1379159 RepID=A0A328P4C6_9GAMM|nr:DUF4097 family beta strand repeat-containing protein [Dyella jiangningensis]RAO75582.1 hypothetical protein CA260_16105 [Dyella jiangningensis]
MRRLLLAALLFAPLVSHADECKYEAPRNLTLDLAGVREVQVDLHSHDLHLNGSSGGAGGSVTGRACASDPKLLDDLVVTQRREGDRLIVEAGNHGRMTISLFKSSYTSLVLNMQIPAQIPVVLNVGSGDAWVTGLQKLSTQVGSGDLHVNKIAGPFSASVGSGDVDVNDVGSLDIGSIGSGDVKVNGVRGESRVGSIGSGDVTIRAVGGSVKIDTVGSGDVRVHDVHGDFTVGAKGSGDVSHSGVQGKVSVPHDRDDD